MLPLKAECGMSAHTMIVLNSVGEPLMCPKCKMNVKILSFDDRKMYTTCDGKCHATRSASTALTAMSRWRKWEDAYNEADPNAQQRLVDRLTNATVAFPSGTSEES